MRNRIKKEFCEDKSLTLLREKDGQDVKKEIEHIIELIKKTVETKSAAIHYHLHGKKILS